ncbi:MAG: hypothetical protein Q4D82_02900, partial [Neisseria sp.]|nr:hypothetical protein [Neisseria sp.]
MVEGSNPSRPTKIPNPSRNAWVCCVWLAGNAVFREYAGNWPLNLPKQTKCRLKNPPFIGKRIFQNVLLSFKNRQNGVKSGKFSFFNRQ